jgi:hypothetical protein
MNKLSTNYIIDGYKGVMSLDIRDIDPKYHKEAIKQHYADIAEYTKYQASLSPRLRYENTIEHVNKIHKTDKDAAIRRNENRLAEQSKKDKIHAESLRNHNSKILVELK